jgi:uncharacterized protein YwqG
MSNDRLEHSARRLAGCFSRFPGLADVKQQISDLAVPSVRMTVEKASQPLAPRGCRLGGSAYVPKGTAWPHSPDRPMGFVGQLDFAALARAHTGALADLPTDGVLSLFCDLETPPFGFDPEDRGRWKLCYTPAGAAADLLAPPDLPPVPEPGMPLSYEEPVPACVLKGQLELSLPSPFDAAFDFLRGEHARDPDPLDDYWNLYYDCYNDHLLKPDGQSHQVLGHPHWVQPDARRMTQLASSGVYCGKAADFQTPRAHALLAGAADWRLLWEVGSDTVAYYWGYGSLFVLIRQTDLLERAFDRCWALVQTT